MNLDPVEQLRAAGCVFAEQEAAEIGRAASNAPHFQELLQRRLRGEPLEWVVGTVDFAGVTVALERGVFIPRPRSEWLVHSLLPELRAQARVVELCCGSGAISLALLHRCPSLQLLASDLDPLAVACARRNLGPDRVLEGDLFAALPDGLRGHVELLIANAPYVPTGELELLPREARLWEAPLALDGGPDGTAIQQRIAAQAIDWLRPGGVLAMETSGIQRQRCLQMLRQAGLKPTLQVDAESEAWVVLSQFG